jgi:hypothetical protein
MRADRLHHVADLVDAHPGRFSPMFVVSKPNQTTPARHYDEHRLRQPDCRLSLCLAGWTLLAFDPDPLHDRTTLAGLRQIRHAGRLLEFTAREVDWALYPGVGSPWGGRHAWANAGRTIRAIADGTLRPGDRRHGHTRGKARGG